MAGLSRLPKYFITSMLRKEQHTQTEGREDLVEILAYAGRITNGDEQVAITYNDGVFELHGTLVEFYRDGSSYNLVPLFKDRTPVPIIGKLKIEFEKDKKGSWTGTIKNNGTFVDKVKIEKSAVDELKIEELSLKE